MYKDEFPNYDDVLYIPSGFIDDSWHNDACPRATKILKDDPSKESLIEIIIFLLRVFIISPKGKPPWT